MGFGTNGTADWSMRTKLMQVDTGTGDCPVSNQLTSSRARAMLLHPAASFISSSTGSKSVNTLAGDGPRDDRP